MKNVSAAEPSGAFLDPGTADREWAAKQLARLNGNRLVTVAPAAGSYHRNNFV